MTLADAQAAIQSDWYAIYLTLQPEEAATGSDAGPPATSQPATADDHTYYASSYRTADAIYCDTDPEWKSLSLHYLVNFPSLDAAVATLPGYHLHRPC